MSTGAELGQYISHKHIIQKNSEDSMGGVKPPNPPLGTPVARPP